MGRHVQAVCQQRHRTGQDARDDLNGHHRPGEGHDHERPPFPWPLQILAEGVAVLPGMKVLSMHA
ncbi:MAG: hypothetical protein NPIRA03_30140 [Nitrospirales bacterium]|nr:MAG: hypothetical protein NPIRA03_30140 [Nitrospirales bacterium]